MTAPVTLLFANNANATLGAAMRTTDTIISLAPTTGQLFPQPNTMMGQYFVLTLTDALTGLVHEIVWVTARSVDTLTVIRAQEGTTAIAWKAGDLAQNLWTAGQATTLSVPAPPAQLAAFNALLASGTLPTSNPGPGGGLYLYGTSLQVGS